MIQHFENEFEIGESVYHITTDSDRGIVVDVSYSVRTKQVTYNIVFGRGTNDNAWYWGDELSRDKSFS